MSEEGHQSQLKSFQESQLNATFKDSFLEEHLLVSSISNHDYWILFDSGAATRCCPKDFASDWPLLPLTGRAPPLRSISGQALIVFGKRIAKMSFDGQDSFLHLYVCNVLYCVVSVDRLLRQGYSVQLSSEDHSLVNPEGCRIPVESMVHLCSFVLLSCRSTSTSLSRCVTV